MSDDESVLGTGTGGAEDDSDNDGDNNVEQYHGYGGGADDGDEEDMRDQEEEEDEEDCVPDQDPSDAEEEAPDPPPPPKKTKAGAGGPGIMAHFFGKPGAKTTATPAPDGPSKASAVARPRGGKAVAAAKPAAAVALAGKQGAAKSTKPQIKEAARPKPTTPSSPFQNESDEEEEEARLVMSLPKKPPPLTPAPDVEQDYLDSLSGGANGCDGTADADGEGEEPPRVADVAKQRRYIIKNEKTGRWAEWKANNLNGLLYAPECTDLFNFTKDDLSVPSKKDRLLMQDKLANQQMSKIMSTMMIGGIKPDGAESNGAPGITNLMALVPSVPPLAGKELEELWKWMGLSEEDEVDLVAMLALDHEIVKRVYKVPNGPLPAIYNPNTNSGNKYKVPAVLEKIKEHDDNFVLWTPETKTKGRAPKRERERAATEEAAPGKTEGKRAASGTKSTANGVADEPSGNGGTGAGFSGNLKFKGFSDVDNDISYAFLTCDPKECYTLQRCGNGKWLLLKAPAA